MTVFPDISCRMNFDCSPESPDGIGATPEQHPKYHRSERSLHLLTTRFITALQESEDGVMDLKEVSGATPVNIVKMMCSGTHAF